MPFFFDHYPYTNFHNINLDWVLQAVKAWGALVEENNIKFHNLEEAMASFRNTLLGEWDTFKNETENEINQFEIWTQNYLQNLDVQEEINTKLDEMLSSGVLSPYFAPYIQSDVSDWLAHNITPTSPAIDASLTISGAGADAAVTGREIDRLKNGLNIKEKRNDFLINKYWKTQNQPIADLDGWICTNKYTVQSRKKYTLVHNLQNPIKEIYAIAYDENGTYITYLKLQNIDCISVDVLLNSAANARYIAFDFNLSDQLPIVAESDIADWYLLVEDNQIDLLQTTVMNGVVKTATVVGSSVVSVGVTWGFKVVKPLSLFAWKQQGLTAKTMTVNIYKQTGQQSSYNTSGTRNDYIELVETRLLQSTDYIILTDIETGTYIEVVSTSREIKYTEPNASPQEISFGYLELGNFPTLDGNVVFRTNENTFAKSFFSGNYIIIPQNRVTSVLANASIACIGDSITEYNYRAYVNWVKYLEKWTGCNIQNLGQSGRGFVNDYAGTSYIDKIAHITGTPDIIGVACSFNDVYTGKGTEFDWSTENGQSAGKVYIDEFWDALITAFPTTPIICYCEGPWENARPGIAKSDGYIETVRRSCNDYGVPFYDNLYYGCALRPWLQANREEYFTSDNIKTGNTGVVDNTHPNSKGHKFIARYLVDKFSQNIYADGLSYK